MAINENWSELATYSYSLGFSLDALSDKEAQKQAISKIKSIAALSDEEITALLDVLVQYNYG